MVSQNLFSFLPWPTTRRLFGLVALSFIQVREYLAQWINKRLTEKTSWNPTMKFPNWWLSTKEILLLWLISSSWRSHALVENVGQSQSYIKKMCCPSRWKLAIELRKETSRKKLNWENRKINRELISRQNLDRKQKWLWIGRGGPTDYEYGFKVCSEKL